VKVEPDRPQAAQSYPEGLTDEDGFTPLTRSARTWLVVGPLLSLAAILLATGLLVGWSAAAFLATVGTGAFIGGGKLVILAGTVDQAPVGTWGVAAFIVAMDLATALITLAGVQELYRLPIIGARVARARASGERVLRRHAWMKRITWLSLAAFVAIPFNGTGALVGTLLGRVLGLSRPSIIMATLAGSATGASALALVGDVWSDRLEELVTRPVIGLAAIVVLLALSTLSSRWLLGREPTVR